jgi:hypothetical protein
MVSVEKCCVCLRLSTGGIILGCFGAFSSLLLVMVMGGFMLNYDNFVERSYERGVGDDIDSKESKKLAMFLETYKRGELEGIGRQLSESLTRIFIDSHRDSDDNISRPSVLQFRRFTVAGLRINKRRCLGIPSSFG